MQAQCPSCAQRIVVDDAKAPDKPFSVKCPKCQALVKFPGRPAVPSAAEEPPSAAEPLAESSPEVLAQLRKEIAGDPSKLKGQVLVALGDRNLAGALTLPLTKLGYVADTLDNPDEGGRMLEQGFYDIIITSRTATIPGRSETLQQRISRLNPEARRRLFIIMVGDEFKTGDGQTAFVAQADLLINPKDAASVESLLLNTISERTRLYQVFLDARRRYEESVG
ncbi:MAG TPA: zinc-ribbon domain-containing protein [Vicinamibacteria bacterium]